MAQEKILLISSEPLHANDTHSSSFEISLAQGYAKIGLLPLFLSVYMITPLDLFKAIFVKSMFGFKKNSNAKRFSIFSLLKYFLGSIIFKRNVYTEKHLVNGFEVWEGIGVNKQTINDLFAFYPIWVATGKEAFRKLNNQAGRPQLIHGHNRFFLGGVLANTLSKENKIPCAVTDHSSYYFRNLVPPEIVPSLRNVYDQANVATAVSDYLAKKIMATTGTCAKIHVVGNALSEIFTQPINFNEIKKPATFNIVSVGRLDENKNQGLLFRAFAMANITDAKLILAGEGEERPALEQLAGSLGISDKVIFAGKLSKADIRSLLLQASVTVISSKVETFSVVTTESHACGVPVISTPCGGPAELITNANGLVLADFEVATMANALSFIYNNISLYYADNICKDALKKYQSMAIANEYYVLFKNHGLLATSSQLN